MHNDLLAIIQGTLQADPNVRLTAELSLAKLSSNSQTGLDLARIATEESLDVSLRQIGFALKKYVKEHWSPFFTTFKGPTATTVEVKAEVRALLFKGLSDPIRKIRLACAVIVSDIAHPDWPDDWPSLTEQLLGLISGSPHAVEGGMRVLNDFVGIDLTEDQLLPIARQLLPQLLVILGSPQTHSPSTRARAVLVFRQCVMTLYTVKDEYPDAVKSAVSEILPLWLEAFRQILEVEVGQELQGENWDGLGVRIAVFNSLEIILNSFPSILKPALAHFLTVSVAQLSSLRQIHHTAYLSQSSDFTPPTSTEDDSAVQSDLPSLIATMLDFVTQVVKRKAVASLLVGSEGPRPLLNSALDVAFAYARMTTDDEESWTSDPNAFIADKDDEMVSYNVRGSAIDFVTSLVDTFELKTLGAMWSAFERMAGDCDAARSRSDEDWWKGYESGLALVGAVAAELLEHIQESAAGNEIPVFNLGRLFSSIIPTYLAASDLPFLQGRSFVFASQFSQALPLDLASQYIDAAISAVEQPEASVPVKISAVLALDNFLRHLEASVGPQRAVRAVNSLLPLLPQTTENTLVLIIETLRVALKAAGSILDGPTSSLLVKTVLSTWFATPEDPMLGAAISELFESLSSIPSAPVQQVILQEALPTLSNLMLEVRTDPFSSRAAAAVDLVDNIFDGWSVPLAPGVFHGVAPAIFEVLATTEDRDLVQSGLHVLTTVVRKDVAQLLTWSSSDGRSGLDLVLAQVARLLDPAGSEAGGLFVGDLVMHLIRKAGPQLGPVLPDLLKAFVSRLQTAETASFSQSLILPFAYLIQTQADTVLSLLEPMEVSASHSSPARPAVEVLLSTWCDTVDVFQGYWNLKVSTVALCQLFLSQRTSLKVIRVKGDLMLTAANSSRIMTRARAKQNPDQYPLIPFHAKALKILLHDIQVAGDDATLAKKGEDDPESDDGDDEWADDGLEFASGDKDLDLLSNMLGTDTALAKYMNQWGSEDGDEDDGDEEDLKDDPVYTLDIQSYLRTFFHQAYASNINSFRQIVDEFLTTAEKDVLAKCLQSA